MQARDEETGGHRTMVAHVITGRCATLDGMGALLVSRRHIDLKRVSSANCSRG
jgi:hypothetical protein